MKKISSKTFIAAAITAALSGCNEDKDADKKHLKEKCYGIVKAGQNGCASGGKTSCSGSATIDGDRAAWMILPKGICSRINGGNLAPKEGVNKITIENTEKDSA